MYMCQNTLWSVGKYIKEEKFSQAYFLTEKPFGGRPWHPGSHGHRLLGAYQAYHYASFIEHALQKLHEEAHKLKRVPTADDMKVDELMSKYGQDSKVFCDKRIFGEVLCQPSLRCYTSFQPMYSPEHALTQLIDGVNESQLARPFPKDERPVFTPSTNDHTNWTHLILPTDISSTVRLVQTNCTDEKWTWSGTQHDGPLVLQIDVKQKGTVIMCSSQAQWNKYPQGWVNVADGAIIEVDGTKKYSLQRFNPPKICVKIEPELAAGHHTIKLFANESSIINLAHVLVP